MATGRFHCERVTPSCRASIPRDVSCRNRAPKTGADPLAAQSRSASRGPNRLLDDESTPMTCETGSVRPSPDKTSWSRRAEPPRSINRGFRVPVFDARTNIEEGPAIRYHKVDACCAAGLRATYGVAHTKRTSKRLMLSRRYCGNIGNGPWNVRPLRHRPDLGISIHRYV